VLSDVFSGLVAAGTLALAAATFRLAFVSDGENRESYKARVDVNAPRIFVTDLNLSPEPIIFSPVAPKFPSSVGVVGTPWDVHKYAGVMLGLVAGVYFRNEGNVSAVVRIEVPDGPTVRVLGFTDMSEDTTGHIETEITDLWGWSIIPPGAQGMIRFVWWRDTSEWLADYRSEGEPPLCEVSLVAKDGLENIRDKCKLKFGASMIGRANVPEGWVLLGPSNGADLVEPVPECYGQFDFVEREYPRLPPSGLKTFISRKRGH